jgi:uncharacterized protein DUF695/regulator of ribonuclease activity B
MRWLKNLFSRSEAAAAPAATAEASAPAPADAPDWASHQRVSGAGPVAIAVDLSLASRAPLNGRPRLVRVRYALRAVRPDGQPEPAEAEVLARVEDMLAGALAPAGAAYVGRVTLAGFREHFFYLPDAVGVRAELDAVRAALADYDLEEQGEDDPAWQAYRQELFPTPRAHRWLLDRRAVEALARRGDRGERARPVDHQASFPTEEAREAFAAEVAALGFEAVARRDDAPPPNGFGVDLRRADPVTLREIHAVAWSLAEAAGRHAGAYDGWEAEPAVNA